MNERLSKGLRKHIRTQLAIARRIDDEKMVKQINQLRFSLLMLKKEPQLNHQDINEPVSALDFSLVVQMHDD